jgi:hypothetical protein
MFHVKATLAIKHISLNSQRLVRLVILTRVVKLGNVKYYIDIGVFCITTISSNCVIGGKRPVSSVGVDRRGGVRHAYLQRTLPWS